jgi:hypothetical protein
LYSRNRDTVADTKVFRPNEKLKVKMMNGHDEARSGLGICFSAAEQQIPRGLGPLVMTIPNESSPRFRVSVVGFRAMSW